MASISVRGLTVRYGAETALDNIKLDLPQGTVTALIGPNGSGKSTLLNALVGLVKPDAGSITIGGRSPQAARREIAYVMQRTEANRLLPVTVREVVMLGRHAELGFFRRVTAHDRDVVARSLERLALSDLADRQLRELSGGQRQRALVAQGLAQGGSVLLLDEPVTGLDLPSISSITAVIEEERATGRTVVVTTHDLGDARQADFVVLLAQRVIAAGTPETVLTSENLLAAYGPSLLNHSDPPVVLGDDHLLVHDDHRRGRDPQSNCDHHID